MKEEKRKKLKAAGWEVGEADDFLELPPDGVKFREERSNKGSGEAFDELPDELGEDESNS